MSRLLRRLALFAATVATLMIPGVGSAGAATLSTGEAFGVTSTAMTFSWSYDGPASTYRTCKRVIYWLGAARGGPGKVDDYDGSASYGACSPGSYELTLSRLAPNTKYSFQAVAALGDYATCSFYCYGDIRSFRTLPDRAPSLSLTQAQTAGDSGVLLTAWTDSEVGSCTLEFGTSIAYGRQQTVPCSPEAPAQVPLSDLRPATTYHARLSASNSVGSAQSPDLEFSTSATPTLSTEAASAVESSSAVLNGVIDARGAAGSFSFEFGLDTRYGLQTARYPLAGTRGPQAVSAATPVALVPGRTYHYRLRVANAFGSWTAQDRTLQTPLPAAPALVAQGGTASVPPAPLPTPTPVGAAAEPGSAAPIIVTCTVRGLQRKSLVKAKAALRAGGCTVGKISKPSRVNRGYKLVVSRYSVRKSGKVDLTLRAVKR